MQSKNTVILSAAGSGKTTDLISRALAIKDKKVLLCTYTNENLEQIKVLIYSQNKFIPVNIEIISWYNFLLQECIRPYQNQMGYNERIPSIAWTNAVKQKNRSQKFLKKEQYTTKDNNIHRDKISEFVYECNKKTRGLIINRLASIYGHIMIDEFQDLSGYDLELLDILFSSSINITLVGDPRQATFSTNNAGKNRQFRKANVLSWIREREKKKVFNLIEKTESYRCNQAICDMADNLYPDFPKTKSKNTRITGHDGFFTIEKENVADYIKQYNPMILRYDKRTDTSPYNARNIGISKGLSFDRVLLFPTNTMLKYLKTKDLKDIGDKTKFYIAITRARYSVAVVYEEYNARKIH
jgi:superfamily I DNA/RNA helicase